VKISAILEEITDCKSSGTGAGWVGIEVGAVVRVAGSFPVTISFAKSSHWVDREQEPKVGMVASTQAEGVAVQLLLLSAGQVLFPLARHQPSGPA